MNQYVESSLREASAALNALLRNDAALAAIEQAAAVLVEVFHRKGRVYACGNGGSMCDAMHFAEELSGRYRNDRRAFAAQAISDPAHLTCVANDWGFERVFARGVEAWGSPGDTLVVFSTSGNSPNVIAAAEVARARGMRVLGLLGRDGGHLTSLCHVCAVVPGTTSDRIQEVHIKIVHLVIEEIERRLVPENY